MSNTEIGEYEMHYNIGTLHKFTSVPTHSDLKSIKTMTYTEICNSICVCMSVDFFEGCYLHTISHTVYT